MVQWFRVWALSLHAVSGIYRPVGVLYVSVKFKLLLSVECL